MSKQVANQQIFIQSRIGSNSINMSENGERLNLHQIDENQPYDRGELIHEVPRFPQQVYLEKQNIKQNQIIQQESSTPQHRSTFKDAKLQQFQQRSLMKQPTMFKKLATAAVEENQQEGEENDGDDKNDGVIIAEDVNLKYGDIIYFKFYKDQSKGIISGDGIAGNKLECVSIGQIIQTGSEEHYVHEHEEAIDEQNIFGMNDEDGDDDDQSDLNKKILNKKASLQFRKCLFRVTNAKKYYYQNLYNQELKSLKPIQGMRNKNQQQKLSDIESKMRGEQEENQRGYEIKEGANVIYGQEIQLEHIYSKCVVTLNPDVLAYEHCCRELSLEESPSQWSNFIVNSANNAKKTGEPVMYKEQICIYSSENPYYWVNIQQSQQYSSSLEDDQAALTNIFDEGLEVNCTDRSVPLKICPYISVPDKNEKKEHNEKQRETEFIQVGDIVYLYNRIVKGRIGVARKTFTSTNESTQFQMKKVEMIFDQNEEFAQRKPLPISVMKVEDYTKNISQQFEIFIDTEEDEGRIETLWEIQRLKNFKSGPAQFDEQIRIKNVWTGLYFYLNDFDELSLTLEGNLEKTFFQIKPKRALQLIQNNLQYQMPVKILQQLSDRTIYVRCKENPSERDEFSHLKYKQQMNSSSYYRQSNRKNIGHVAEEKKEEPKAVTSISSFNIKKDKRGEIEFEINKVDPKLKKLADRVSSLFPYLLNFYVFLQGWGNKIIKKENGSEEWRYDYSRAFNSQKALYNYVQQLYQSVENLKDFLQMDQFLKQRQKILLDAGIVEIILLILKLIHYKIYCHCELDQLSQDHKIIDYKNIPDKSAQKIASIKLLKCIGVLYDLLEDCIKGNSENSSFVLRMQQDNFLFNQIKYHKTEVVQLLKEATRYVDGDQKEQNIENMRKWVNKINQISAHNIQEQTFIIELLCLSITDHLEQPIPEYQNACRKLLFSKPKHNKDEDEINNDKMFGGRERKYTGYLQKMHLISFKLDSDNTPYIIFNVHPNQKSKFEHDNQDLYYTGKKPSIRDEQNINHFPFDHINGAQAKGKQPTPQSINIEKYEVYVLQVLNLYALLIAERNLKSIKCLQSIGLTKDYIYRCLQSKKIDNNHLRQYRSILNLYESFILNVPPFIPISSYHNLVFLKDDFNSFNPKTQASYQLFRQIVVNQETKNIIREEYIKMTEKVSQSGSESNESKLLQQYAKLLVEREMQTYQQSKTSIENKQSNGPISSLRIQEELINSGVDRYEIIPKLNHNDPIYKNNKVDLAKLSKFMIETFLQMLRVLKTRVNLGYNTPQENQDVLNIIPNLFFALIDFKAQESFMDNSTDMEQAAAAAQKKEMQIDQYQSFNKNWIYDFIYYNLQYCYDDLLITKVFIEAVSIVNIINKLNMYLFIVETIQEKKVEFSNQSLEYFYQYKFSLEDYNKNKQPKQINLCVLIMQTMEYLRRDPILEQTMFKTLIKNFEYLKDLQDQMIEVEIIEDPIELELYKEVNGISENQNLKSPQDIKQLVQKAKYYFEYYEQLNNEGFFQQNPIKMSQEDELIYNSKTNKLTELEKNFDTLSAAIDQCIGLLSQKKSGSKEQARFQQQHYLLQLQNIFRHTRIPEYFLLLLKNVPQYNSFFIQFYRKIVLFFELYTKDNTINKRRILEFIPQIMNLCLIPNDQILQPEKQNEVINNKSIPPIKISRLCIQLLEDVKNDQQIIKDIINNIINLIEENVPFNMSREQAKGQNWKTMKYKIYRYGVDELKCLALIQYFKILKSLTFKSSDVTIQANQLQILNNFMHKKILSDIIQPIIESYLTKFGIKFELPNEYLKLKLHCQGIILLSQCCKDNKIGIQEVQRFVMFDTLKAIVISQYAPFILKRAYLKCLFEAYVNKVYDLEKEGSNETISNLELNDILSSEIIPILRLTTSYKYLEGLISNKDHAVEQESLNNLRANIIRKKFNHFKGDSSYDQVIWSDEQRRNDQENKIVYQGIVNDCSEYWKYLFKEGVIHFVTDSYDEFTDIINNSISEGDHQGSVLSNFKIIGFALQELLQQIEIAEKEFKVLISDTYVDYETVRSALEVIPIGNPKTSGKNIYIKLDKDSKQQMNIMSKNNQDMQAEQKIQKEIGINQEFPIEQEYLEIQKQFKLQLLRKRITVKDFILIFIENFSEYKQVNKALFQSLNSQKIIYTPSQVNYILKKYFTVDVVNGNTHRSGRMSSNKKKQSSINYESEQFISVLKKLNELGGKIRRNEITADLNVEQILSLYKNSKKIKSQQAVIDLVKIKFGKYIKQNIKKQLNILKKSILDNQVEIDLNNPNNNKQQIRDKYSEDIDNCIADYEITNSANSNNNNNNNSSNISEAPLPFLQINPSGAQSSLYQEEDEEEELGKIEKTFLNRMMIDSQIVVFLRDIQKELNIFGVELDEENQDKNGEGGDEDEENEEEGLYQASSEVNPQRRIFQSYIELFSSVFSGQKYYLVKIVRLILESVQIDDFTMSQLTSTSPKERKKATAKFELLQLCQAEVAKQEIFVHAMKFIRVSSSYDLVQEGLTFMICMLNRGNQEAQNKVLSYLENDQDALVDFFSYLRHFFNQEISQQIKVMNDQQNVSDIPTEFEILSLKILRLIQLLCENVNQKFQLFLMKQTNDESSLLSNYNVTLEVSTFLSIFLEDDLLEMSRKQNIIVQCIDTLNECISGQKQVLECVARNKRLFNYLNEKIIRQKKLYFKPMDFKQINDPEREEAMIDDYKKKLELFQSAMKFMLTIVSGIADKEELTFLFEQIQTEKLISVLVSIYKHRIKPKQQQILMDQRCLHINRKDKIFLCNEDFCQENNVTSIEQLIISIGFNIFIIFYYFRDIFPEEKEKLLAFYLNEKEDLDYSLDLGLIARSIKKAETAVSKARSQMESPAKEQEGKKSKKLTFLNKKSTMKKNKDEDEDSFDPLNEEDVQSYAPKKDDMLSNETKEKMTARQLLSQGLAHVILRDIEIFDKGDINRLDDVENRGEGEIFKRIIKDAIDEVDLEEVDKEILTDKNQSYFKFFMSFIGSAEVKNQNDKIQKVYFQKPFYTKFLTLDIKKHLIYQADRDSDTERLMFLIDHTTFYEEQMIHKQYISQWGFFSYIADKWRLYKDLSYYLVIALTIITLTTYGTTYKTGEEITASSDKKVGDDGDVDVQRTFQVVSYIQLVLSLAILISCAIERYPISINRNVSSQIYEMVQSFKRNSGFPDDEFKSLYNRISNELYNFLSPKNAKNKLYVKCVLVAYDSENLYNLAYLIITGLAFYNNLIYSFLLLDIVKRSEDLQNVISSITKNAFNLLKFAFLGIVIMYIYGIIGYYSFQSDYSADEGGISDTFVLTITSTIKEGLRKGGGVADSMSSVDYESDQLWSRYFFDLTFFIVINMLFIQIIFGIILDTFGELRDNRSNLIELVNETCYICGLSRRYVEANSEVDWHHHIYMEHNCYNLLFYIIYIKRKSENDCDALEKHIKKCLEKKDQQRISFIPINSSLSIEKFRSDGRKPSDNTGSDEEDTQDSD